MKPVFAVAFSACVLLACSSNSAQAATPSKAPLQRLVGTLSIVEDHAVSGTTGAPFVTRKTVLQGSVDQLVRVQESSGTLRFTPEGGGRLQMKGTVVETGQLTLDDPNSNSLVKTRGESKYTGKLGDYELSIARSKLGIGDEFHFRFNTKMSGKAVVTATHRNGMTSDLSESAAEMGLSMLEPNPSDRTPMFKRELDLLPLLGAVPAEPFEKQFYEGIKKFPALFHLGLTTSPNRQIWTYAGTKVYSKPGDKTQWTERVELSFKLLPQ